MRPCWSLPQTLKEFYKDVTWIIHHPGLWLNGIYAGLLFSVITVFAALWGLPYLVVSQHVSLPVSTCENALAFVGIAIGCPMMGWIYPRLANKNLFLCVAALVTALLCSWLIYATPMSTWLNALLFLFVGIFCSSYVFNYALANQLVPKHIRSTSIGFTNTLCVAATPLLQPLGGWILHLTANIHHPLGQEIYSISNYHWALSIIPTVLIMAAIIAIFLPKLIHSTPLFARQYHS